MEHSGDYSRKVLFYTKGVPKGISFRGLEDCPPHALSLIAEIIMEHSGALFDMPSNEIQN
jgi:hypothetical protein